jgi:hypothetical protein
MQRREHFMADNKSTVEQLGVDERGNWQYPASATEGYVEIEIPSLPGSLNPTESLHMREFGGHVVSKIESSMNTGYLRKQSPHQVLAHYAAVARGASLMDEPALKRLESLATEFESVPEREEYFSQVVKPYLLTLTPKRRQP